MIKPPPLDALPVNVPVYPLPLDPQPGLYRGRMVRGGPVVAILIASVAGRLRAFVNHDAEIDVHRAWLSGADKPIDRAEYLRLVRLGDTIGSPHNSPATPVDLATLKPITPKVTK